MKFQKTDAEQYEEKYFSQVPKKITPIIVEHEQHGCLVNTCRIHDREQYYFFGLTFLYYIQ